MAERPDDDLARLQRIAFGSGSSDAERADASRELEARLVAASADTTGAAEAALTGDPADAGVPPTAPASAPGPADADGVPEPPTTASQRRWLQLLIGVGAGALVVGIAAGWQLGASQTGEQPAADPSATPYNGAQTLAEYNDTLPIALETPAADVFDRPPTDEDVPDELPRSDARTDAPEFRVLAATQEGARIYASREGIDLCLTVVTPASAGIATAEARTCTEDGRFPEDGLEVHASAVREIVDRDGSTNFVLTSFVATWTAGGSLSFGPER